MWLIDKFMHSQVNIAQHKLNIETQAPENHSSDKNTGIILKYCHSQSQYEI